MFILKLSTSHVLTDLARVLSDYFSDDHAKALANIFLDAELDGVKTHGLTRFPRFISEIKKGYINTNVSAEVVRTFGGWEMWDGHAAPGPLNAVRCTDRVVELAKKHGIACVGLKNTNHWLRPGYYAKQAAGRGCAFIAWSNTMPNMRAHGAQKTSLSNLPITIALPRDANNEHLVLTDLALSQFSYGKLAEFENRQQNLPIDGGYDSENKLTRNPKVIHEHQSASAIGFWKGSALSIVFDLLATFLSGGRSTLEIGETEGEQNVSQVYIAMALDQLWSEPEYSRRLAELKEQLKKADANLRVPGDGLLAQRELNSAQTVAVPDGLWEEILSL